MCNESELKAHLAKYISTLQDIKDAKGYTSEQMDTLNTIYRKFVACEGESTYAANALTHCPMDNLKTQTTGVTTVPYEDVREFFLRALNDCNQFHSEAS
ncbi:MAG: hypothetical protein S4CHLAM102_00520 [Chlamydiia bacterium]|nr:hypothetical protein [Chlamydiia bacterium]